MREIEIKFVEVGIDEVITELAEYIKNGYHVKSINMSTSSYSRIHTTTATYSVELVKY